MDKVYQISLLQALVNGYFDGVITTDELKKYGNTAIGTFDGADGELIMLDGVIYKAKVDGNVEVITSDKIPFSNVTTFTPDDKINLSISDINDLKDKLNKYNSNNKNMLICIKINGLFKQITVRSIPKQNKPYKNLNYVVEHEQKTYTYNNLEGTLVGFCFPYYLDKINSSDYHMHFISKDKTKGGHVLGLTFDNLDCLISVKNILELILPNTDSFKEKNYNINQELVKKVEE